MTLSSTNPRNITEGWHAHGGCTIYIRWLDDVTVHPGWYYTTTPANITPDLHQRVGPFSTSELAYEDAIEELSA